ncbi:uncharacterized protein LOC132055471 [Lycium ferocissimum]|uniref:uncharacterized protein LOC132055471 n=1 Tax=Lycium ferocissimum TaxID=112874 RepID=UPI0028168D46|nr:uncharacterized protein LOC132055471 [Lycium ferocissimum]
MLLTTIMADRVMLPPNLRWGRRRGRGLSARQTIDPVEEAEETPPSQPQTGTTADAIAAMFQQAMESLVERIQTQPRAGMMPGGYNGHNQPDEPLRRSIREFLDMKPPVFTGASETEDPLLFLDGIQKALDALECSKDTIG